MSIQVGILFFNFCLLVLTILFFFFGRGWCVKCLVILAIDCYYMYEKLLLKKKREAFWVFYFGVL